MKIRFENPLSFDLEVIEIDNKIPSMRVSVSASIDQFQHTLEYKGTFWIECTKWSNFKNSLRDSLSTISVLDDMSEQFSIKIERNNNIISFYLEFVKKDICKEKTVKLNFSADIDDDVFGKIRDEFLDFPEWW